MMNANVLKLLSDAELIALQMAVTDPIFINVAKAHVDYFNRQMTIQDIYNIGDFVAAYRHLKQQRDNWLEFQKFIAETLARNPGFVKNRS